MVSFNTTVRQMTEMFQWSKCLRKNWPKCFSEKRNPGLKHKYCWYVWHWWHTKNVYYFATLYCVHYFILSICSL